MMAMGRCWCGTSHCTVSAGSVSAGMHAVRAPVYLVAEGQALIAMSLEADLEEVGIKIAGHFCVVRRGADLG